MRLVQIRAEIEAAWGDGKKVALSGWATQVADVTSLWLPLRAHIATTSPIFALEIKPKAADRVRSWLIAEA